MKTDINELITLGYELEGLLLLALHRGDDTPRQVWQMIDAHIKSLANGVANELEGEESIVACGSEDQQEQAVYDSGAEMDGSAVQDETTRVEVAVQPEITVVSEEPAVEPAQPEESEEPEVSPVMDDPDMDLTLDEKLARANSRCLRRAFSLNDRFRFRRELFGNSDAAITDTLDLVEAMRSIDEARDYFFDELEWDPENQEVKDFMEIVTKHFLSR